MGVWGAGLQGKRAATTAAKRAKINVQVEDFVEEVTEDRDEIEVFTPSTEFEGVYESTEYSPDNTGGSSNDGPGDRARKKAANKVAQIKTAAQLAGQYNLWNGCFRLKMNRKYIEMVEADTKRGINGGEGVKEFFKNIGEELVEEFVDTRAIKALKKDINKNTPFAARYVYARDKKYALQALYECALAQYTQEENQKVQDNSKQKNSEQPIRNDLGGPFDRRLYRTYITGANEDSGELETELRIPFSVQSEENALSATSGYFAGSKTVQNLDNGDLKAISEKIAEERKKLQKDNLYIGTPALQNTYALTKLYGSDGGRRLLNRRNERRWYEVDQSFTNGRVDLANYSSTPTTSSLILWGNGDPYARTPYHFTDFVFAKYWNKIENNRLITLRRFAAPILDNMKFPGMDGVQGENTGKKAVFPPMASAITYFGEETGNNLKDLLKFKTGVKWGETKAEVWKVESETTPSNESGPAGIYGGVGKLSKMLAIGEGNFDPKLLMNDGNLPPDPYSDGPYENRIQGPVNRIDTVKKRDPGIDFDWSGLNLQFEYVARPVGGVNPKAALLDILSNFLVLGSASAVFFGGQHRFMSNPAKYPFLGGEKGIQSWFRGDPIGWAGHSIKSVTNQLTDQDSNIFQNMSSMFEDLFSANFGQAVKGFFKEGGIGMNIIKAKVAEKSAGTVPYLRGLRALLTGEPVGEWHVTIGNPLNPIAMIGNLICTSVEVEFGDELGPDDFPTEIKFTVNLDHGMARDRDSIESVFNRGMGRIYDLPDEFDKGSQTAVDANTQDDNEMGQPLAIKGWMAGPSKLGGRTGPAAIKEPSNSGAVSVWNRAPFQSVSRNQSLVANNNLIRSGYTKVDWIALKSLK